MSNALQLPQRRCFRTAFTLTEMMIAMAVTLLLMAALGKVFALMGETIREGRVKVNLTSDLRDITLRINSDLSRCTVPIAPSSEESRGDGYFVYYEGPLSDATGTLMGRSPDATNENTLQDSKFGDLDDYIAFTAVAEPGNWYRGKVPRYILDMKSVDLLPANQDANVANDIAYDPTDFPGNPFDPIVITSKYAEIIYFASPEYVLEQDTDDASKLIYQYNADPLGSPQYVDDDGNGLPDRIRLHRRVLLIRPDLVLTSPTGGAAGATGTAATGSLGQWVHTHANGTITYLSPDAFGVDTSIATPAIKTVATHGISRAQTSNAWLIGMAPVHQQCDLSVRRLLGPNGLPGATVVANSLADLSKPENRFAHVRIPGALIQPTHNSSKAFTSMPLLAMGALPNILDPATNGAVPNSGTVITPLLLNGFLRPEFVLGMDHSHTEVFGDGWGMERLSEDVLATDVLGFDIKGFDETAPSFISFGNDGLPGVGGFDDDQDGANDNLQPGGGPSLEAGFAGSDDVVIGPNDAGMREALIYRSSNPAEVIFSQSGDFVDLFYPFLAGGTIRGPAAVRPNLHTPAANAAAIGGNFRTTFRLNSQLSGMGNDLNPPPLYSDSLMKSGRMITNASNGVQIVQPAYDTFSNHYERDGFLQSYPSNYSGGFLGTVWYLNDATGIPRDGTGADVSSFVDQGSDGLDNNPGTSPGTDDPTEEETSAPFDEPLSAIKVTLRLENSTTRQIEQMSSITHFDD